MKTLQKTQKRAYTSPAIEVLEAENDMKFLMASATIIENDYHAKREDFSGTMDDENEGFKD